MDGKEGARGSARGDQKQREGSRSPGASSGIRRIRRKASWVVRASAFTGGRGGGPGRAGERRRRVKSPTDASCASEWSRRRGAREATRTSEVGRAGTGSASRRKRRRVGSASAAHEVGATRMRACSAAPDGAGEPRVRGAPPRRGVGMRRAHSGRGRCSRTAAPPAPDPSSANCSGSEACGSRTRSMMGGETGKGTRATSPPPPRFVVDRQAQPSRLWVAAGRSRQGSRLSGRKLPAKRTPLASATEPARCRV